MLLDSTNFNASDSNESLLPDERGSFVDDTLRQEGNRESIKAEAKRNAQKNAQARPAAARPVNLNQRISSSQTTPLGQGGESKQGSARQKLGRDPQKLSGYGGAGGSTAMKSSGAGRAKPAAEKSKQIPGKSGGKGDAVAAAKETASSIPVVGNKITAKIDELQQDEGRLIGFLLWVIWGLLAIAGAIISITIVGAVLGGLVILIFNLLLVSPRLVYRLTVWILDLFGIGEFLQGAEKSGLIDKHTIRIGGFEKTTIILFDLVVFIGIILMLVMFVYFSCWLGEQSGVLGSGTAQILLAGYDWWYGTEYASIVDQVCGVVK
ncbi:MAG TPA: hypothetical protein PKD34_00710 [Candidatus Doudnabacteria bacterium]|nr:hypothetical protein [Candidatus Doudnabacteria bacterium]